jgi:hypothetical protein
MIGLLKTNVAVKKRKGDLALLTTDTSMMDAEVKAWHKAQCNLILQEMQSPPASSTPLESSNPSPTSATLEAPSTLVEDDPAILMWL